MKCCFPVELIRRAYCSDEEKMQLYSFVQQVVAQSRELRRYSEFASIHEENQDIQLVHEVYFSLKQERDIHQLYIEPLLQSSYFGVTLLKKLISIIAAIAFVDRDSKQLVLVRIASLFSPPNDSEDIIQDWLSKLS